MQSGELPDSSGSGEGSAKEDVPTCIHTLILSSRRWIEININYDEKEWKLEDSWSIDHVDDFFLAFKSSAVSSPSSVLFHLHIPFTTFTIPVELRGSVARLRLGPILSTRLSDISRDSVFAQRRSKEGRESVFPVREMCTAVHVGIRTVNDSFGHALSFYRGVRIQGQLEGIPSEVSTLHTPFLNRLLYGDFKWKESDWAHIWDLAGEDLIGLSSSLFMPVLIETPIGRAFCRQLGKNRLFGFARLLGMWWCPPLWLRDRIASPENQYDFIDLDQLLENLYIAEMLKIEITIVRDFFDQLSPDESMRDLHNKFASRFSDLYDKLNVEESETTEDEQETAADNGSMEEEEGEFATPSEVQSSSMEDQSVPASEEIGQGIATPLCGTPTWNEIEEEKPDSGYEEITGGLKKEEEVKMEDTSFEVLRPPMKNQPEQEIEEMEQVGSLPISRFSFALTEDSLPDNVEEKENQFDIHTPRESDICSSKEETNERTEEEGRREKEGEQSEIIPSQIASINGIMNEANCEKSIGFDGVQEFDWIATLNAPVFIPREAKKEEKIEENREIEKNEEAGDGASPISEYFPVTPTLSEIDMTEYDEGKMNEGMTVNDEGTNGGMEDKKEDEMKMEDYQRDPILTQEARIDGRSDEVKEEEKEKEIIQDAIPSPVVNVDAGRSEKMKKEKEKEVESLDSSSHSWTYHKGRIHAPLFASTPELEKSSMEDPPKSENEKIGLDQIPVETANIDARLSTEVEEDERTLRDSTSPVCDDFPDTPTFSEIDETEWNDGERKEMKMEKEDEEEKGRKEEKEAEGNEKEEDQRASTHSFIPFHLAFGKPNGGTDKKVEDKMEANQRDVSPKPASRRRSRSNIEDENEEREDNGSMESEYHSLDGASESEEKTTVDTVLPEKKAWRPNWVFD
ncbi:hypothetical protein PENTCL1PPCAC_7832 [Pristionchus entomophagus]|uniref:Uncharacterized protein n=1 Tax=Pristionchus entomophagus TaxID=358040 RepID=A0AAV5SSA2_9BILA|nr:hypothetical protein PENTCL1PPCAC_7832 [Pristionchus entomophagus]